MNEEGDKQEVGPKCVSAAHAGAGSDKILVTHRCSLSPSIVTAFFYMMPLQTAPVFPVPSVPQKYLHSNTCFSTGPAALVGPRIAVALGL